jgi:hypothetical protein
VKGQQSCEDESDFNKHDLVQVRLMAGYCSVFENVYEVYGGMEEGVLIYQESIFLTN